MKEFIHRHYKVKVIRLEYMEYINISNSVTVGEDFFL